MPCFAFFFSLVVIQWNKAFVFCATWKQFLPGVHYIYALQCNKLTQPGKRKAKSFSQWHDAQDFCFSPKNSLERPLSQFHSLHSNEDRDYRGVKILRSRFYSWLWLNWKSNNTCRWTGTSFRNVKKHQLTVLLLTLSAATIVSLPKRLKPIYPQSSWLAGLSSYTTHLSLYPLSISRGGASCWESRSRGEQILGPFFQC